MKKKQSNKVVGAISLEKKLKAYSLAAISVVAVQPATADVVYTDVNPDKTLNANDTLFMIDLNDDGTDDFGVLLISNATESASALFSLPGNEALGSALNGSSHFYPFALSLNDSIDENQTTWNGSISSGYGTLGWIYASGGTYGNWLGATDKYAGVRIKIGNDWHYGWIRFDVPLDATSVTIKDFAYESTPNTVIKAGSTVASGIADPVLPNSISLFAGNNILTVDLKDVKLNDASILLMSINGQLVLEEKITGNRMDFNLQGLRTGIYLATIKSKEGILSRKIFVE